MEGPSKLQTPPGSCWVVNIFFFCLLILASSVCVARLGSRGVKPVTTPVSAYMQICCFVISLGKAKGRESPPWMQMRLAPGRVGTPLNRKVPEAGSREGQEVAFLLINHQLGWDPKILSERCLATGCVVVVGGDNSLSLDVFIFTGKIFKA